MDRSRSRTSKSVLATAALAVLAFIPLARGAGGDWAWFVKHYDSQLAKTPYREGRFELIDHAAFACLMVGELEKAKAYAEESLALAPDYPSNWNYGNAIHHSHLVLGHLWLLKGDIEGAEKELSAAAQTPGSKTLRQYGPNMALAKALLEKGRRTSVLAYFEECRRFWKDDLGHLDAWKAEVERGEIPDFKANLLY